MSAAKQAVILCAAGRGDPSREVGGLTLIERLARQLSELDGMEEILVISAPGTSPDRPSERVAARVRTVESQHGEPWRMLRGAQEWLRHRFLVVAGDLLVDERLLAWLATQSHDTLVRASLEEPPELVGSIGAEGLRRSGSGPVPAVVVSATAFPNHWPARRGSVPVHLLRVTDGRAAEAAWRILLDHAQKRALDLPARTFDPAFENFLVRRMAPTRITPNQVTAATGVLGFLATALFLAGWLRLGVLLAIAVEVLDGVDGKLARVKRMTSRIGELEHVLDFFYENSWYLALGIFLSRQGASWAWGAALAMVAFDLANNLTNLAYSRSRGRSLAEASPFVLRFRAVSGRRNIYAWMFLPGFLLGVPAVSFAAAVAWAGVTAAIDAALAALHAAPGIGSAQPLPRRDSSAATA